MSNHLAGEKSPYLLQHSENPVDWYPWGAEALDRAVAEDKPIFLSIGYSTCHWCHVMAEESFVDPQVAELLNASYIPVKVDREERPDLDTVYMTATQAMTGAGGWPMTVLLTPDQKPFFAGTYFPRPQLLQILSKMAYLWRSERGLALAAAERVAASLRRQEQRLITPLTPDWQLPQQAAARLKLEFDPRHGGFGAAPKFPLPTNLLFLLAWSEAKGDGEARRIAETTLEQMARGGIFDQIGGGFCRYSTDDRWLIPHFEKTLYDNALLALAYCEAFRLSGRPLWRDVARRTLDYILRELRLPAGGLAGGQDADSEGGEGAYYLWTPAEVKTVLGEEAGERFCLLYNITDQGNFNGRSLPHRLDSADLDSAEEMAAERQKLYQYRRQRIALRRDDKALCGWNALAIWALARAASLLDAAPYLEAARQVMAFLERELTTEAGQLLVRWTDGEAKYPGLLTDYAFTALAALELYAADRDPARLEQAARLLDQVLRHFGPREDGGLYLYADTAERLISRPVETDDGALPSGNSAAALAMTRLAAIGGGQQWRRAAERQLRLICGAAALYPAGQTLGLLAVAEYLGSPAAKATAAEPAPSGGYCDVNGVCTPDRRSN